MMWILDWFLDWPIFNQIYSSRRVTEVLKKKFALLKKQGAIFTMTADEWCRQRKRFLGKMWRS